MRQDNAASHHPFRAEGPVWPHLISLFDGWLKSGISDVEMQQFNRSFASYPCNDRRYRGYAAHMGATDLGDQAGWLLQPQRASDLWYARANELFLQHLQAKDVHSILGRTEPSSSGMVVDVNGKKTSWDYLLSANEVMSMIEAVPTLLDEPLTVLDLGSGWGRLGHLLLQLNPQLAYVACDLPEALIIAQEYLPRHLDASTPVCRYSDNRRASFSDLSPGAWFVGTHDLDRFADSSIDLFVNVSSFQEMTLEMVTSYLGIIDRVAKNGSFYTRQRLKGDVVTRERYPWPKGWLQLYDRPTLTPPGFFEAAFRT